MIIRCFDIVWWDDRYCALMLLIMIWLSLDMIHLFILFVYEILDQECAQVHLISWAATSQLLQHQNKYKLTI